MKRIELIATEGLAPGMLVAESVVDDSGRVLIPAGAELSEGAISSLTRREIQAVMVELTVLEDPEAVEARRAKTKQHLDHLFRLAGNSAETKALYQAILDYRMEQGA